MNQVHRKGLNIKLPLPQYLRQSKDHSESGLLQLICIFSDIIIYYHIADPFIILNNIYMVSVKGETVTLMGQQALNYVRIRAGMEDSSNLNRMKRQQQYLEALAEKVQNLGDDFSISAEQISLLSDYVISDCSIDELKRMAEEFVNYEIQPMQDIKGTALKGEEYMEFYPDQQALEEQILELFYEVKEVADEDATQPS